MVEHKHLFRWISVIDMEFSGVYKLSNDIQRRVNIFTC